MKNTTKVITKIEYQIALVIISFIVAFPAGAFAAPAIQALNDPAVIQVKDSLRQIAEAATLWKRAGGCNDWDCTDVNLLVAAGKLTAAPQWSSGIGVDDTPLIYNGTRRRMGGCGPGNSGAPTTFNPALNNVSEQFCRNYNNSVGLGSTIVENCKSGVACASTDPFDFPLVDSRTFCFRRHDEYAIVWMTTISAPPCR